MNHMQTKELLPNYRDGSIVNLMASIAHNYDAKTPYTPLKGLHKADLSKKTVLFVIDGMGYELLRECGQHTFLWKHTRHSITSVFPSTTAAAVTAMQTGLAPQQHGLTGWYMYLKEIGMVGTILRFIPRIGGAPFNYCNISPYAITGFQSFFDLLRVPTHTVLSKKICQSPMSRVLSGKATRHGYTTMKDFFTKTKHALAGKKSVYVYAYWSELDTLAHECGYAHKKVAQHLHALDHAFEQFVQSMKGTGITVLVTADHGHMMPTKKCTINLKDHPRFVDMLTLPLCGEPRVAYCYVRPSKEKEFVTYVKTHFNRYCTLHKSDDLIKKGYFGLGKHHAQHPQLANRVGDYTLIMKPGYIIKQSLLGEQDKHHKGEHGGTSSQEMLVPLIVIKM